MSMKQVFFAQPMAASLTMGKEMYEVVRRGTKGELQPTAYYGMLKEDAEEKAKELNEDYNNQNN